MTSSIPEIVDPMDEGEEGGEVKTPPKKSGFLNSFKFGMRSIWATKQTEETKGNLDLTITTTIRELFIYCLFLLVLCIMSFGPTNSSTYNLNNVMRNLFLDTPADAKNPRSNFLNLNLPEDYFVFLEKVLIPNLYSEWDSYHGTDVDKEGRGFLLYENQLQGVPRLKQVRVKNDSCPIPDDFSSQIKVCYSAYSEKSMETAPFGLINGTAWSHSTEKDLKSSTVNGQISSYDGGGYYVDLGPDANTSLAIVKELKKHLWVDRATRAIFVDFTIYNANLNYFCVVKLIAEFPATGGIVPSSILRPVKLIRYTSTKDYVVLACEVAFCIFILYYIVEEILEIKKHGCSYFREFWNIIDIIVIVISILVIAFNVYSFLEVKLLLVRILENPFSYIDFDFISYWLVIFSAALSINCFLSWIKIFKYISFNKTMTQLSSTLGASSKDLSGFAIMFFIIFLAFAQLGYIMFGTQDGDFNTYSSSIFTLFRLILGDFDFQSLQQANRVLGPAYFILYVFFVFFVLLNMFIAIINDTYVEVKAELAEKANEIEFSDFLKKRATNVMDKFNARKNVGKKDGVDVDLEVASISNQSFHEGKKDGKKDEEGYESGEEGGEKKDEEKEKEDELVKMRERVRKMEGFTGTLLYKMDCFLGELESMERCKEVRVRQLCKLVDKIVEQNEQGGRDQVEKQMEKGMKEEHERWKRDCFLQIDL